MPQGSQRYRSSDILCVSNIHRVFSEGTSTAAAIFPSGLIVTAWVYSPTMYPNCILSTPVKLLNKPKILTTISGMLYGRYLLFLIQLLLYAVLQSKIQQKFASIMNPCCQLMKWNYLRNRLLG